LSGASSVSHGAEVFYRRQYTRCGDVLKYAYVDLTASSPPRSQVCRARRSDSDGGLATKTSRGFSPAEPLFFRPASCILVLQLSICFITFRQYIRMSNGGERRNASQTQLITCASYQVRLPFSQESILYFCQWTVERASGIDLPAVCIVERLAASL